MNMTLKQNVDRFMKVGHTSKTSPTQELNQDVTRQSGSWRQAIFNRVVTPNKNLSGKQYHERGLIRNSIHYSITVWRCGDTYCGHLRYATVHSCRLMDQCTGGVYCPEHKGIILFWNGATPCHTAQWHNQEDHNMINISSVCVCWQHWQLIQLKS